MNVSEQYNISYQIGYELIVLLRPKKCKIYNLIDVVFNKFNGRWCNWRLSQKEQMLKKVAYGFWLIRTLIKLEAVKEFLFYLSLY